MLAKGTTDKIEIEPRSEEDRQAAVTDPAAASFDLVAHAMNYVGRKQQRGPAATSPGDDIHPTKMVPRGGLMVPGGFPDLPLILGGFLLEYERFIRALPSSYPSHCGLPR